MIGVALLLRYQQSNHLVSGKDFVLYDSSAQSPRPCWLSKGCSRDTERGRSIFWGMGSQEADQKCDPSRVRWPPTAVGNGDNKLLALLKRNSAVSFPMHGQNI